MSTTGILEQVLDPFVDCLTPEAARRLSPCAEPIAQTRLDELADRANEGLLNSVMANFKCNRIEN